VGKLFLCCAEGFVVMESEEKRRSIYDTQSQMYDMGCYALFKHGLWFEYASCEIC
jgi:hypothetical protein